MGTNEIISADSLRLLSAQVQQAKMAVHNLQRRMSAYINDLDDTPDAYIAISGSTGITAGTSSIASPGTVTLVTVSTSGLMESSARTETAYNVDTTAVPASTYLQVKREALTRRLLVDYVAKKKTLIRFLLSAALAKTDASKSATISFQVGPGEAHSGTVTVTNPSDVTNGNYTYAGASGASGWAVWDSGTTFHIIDIDCEA